MIACLNPSLCGVQSHRDSTTNAPCMIQAGGAKSGSMESLGSRYSPAQPTATYQPSSPIEFELQRRTENPQFIAMLDEREAIKARLEKAWELENSGLLDAMQSLQNRRGIKTDTIRMSGLRMDIEQYKDETAKIAEELSEEIEQYFTEYQGKKLGNAEYAGTFKSGTRPWLEERRNGVGGSDVGLIIGTNAGYEESDWEAVYLSKVAPLSDEDVDGQNPTSGPIYRGNAWESVIYDRFQSEHPELELIHTKATWRNGLATINVDGLISSTGDGVPDGIFEAKTSSRPEDWADGPPKGYLAQVTHYMERVGVDYAYVAVMIDDREFRSYRIERDQVSIVCQSFPEGGSSEQIAAYVDKCYKYMVDSRSDYQAPQEEGSKPKQVRQGPYTYRQISDSMVRSMSAYMELDQDEFREQLQSRVDRGASVDGALRSMVAEYDPSTRQRNIAFIDLETNGSNPNKDEIIEVGITIRNSQNEVVDQYQELFSTSPDSLRSRGIDFQDVHHISEDMVADKTVFRDDHEAHRRIMEKLDGCTISAHNYSFENLFLRMDLPGFAEADAPVIDTMHIARYWDDSHGASLEAFSSNNGIEYAEAHRALNDTNMSADAFWNWQNKHRSQL